MDSPINLVLSRLQGVKQTGEGKWKSICPAHSDKNPSLSIAEANDTVLLKCWAGCGAVDVLDAIGLQFSDLYPKKSDLYSAGKPEKKAPFSCCDALRGLNGESYLVLVLAHDVARGVSLSVEALERLELSIDRIHTARSLVLKHG